MERENKRKGFTIVELVITIAVIGVLTAILVPTFIGLTRKANEASDDSLVTNLNKALAIHEVQPGDTHNDTYQDAIDDLYAEGYRAEVLVTKSGKTLLWCEKDNRFHLDSEGVIKDRPTGTADTEFWAIYTSKPEQQKYSIYAAEGWTGNAENLTVGFDAGTNDDIESVSYVRASGESQTVTIRSNGGTITVNAPGDSVKHYGMANVVTLTAVASESFYEYGSSNLVDIKTGRLVITNETQAEVGTIYLTATEDAYDGIILATQNGAELPEVVAREQVSLPTSGEKLVVTIQSDVDAQGKNPSKTESIYLYPQSDVKEVISGYDVSDLGLLVVEAISSDGIAEATEQLSGKGENVLEAVKEEKVQDLEDISTGAMYFAGGSGTEKSPYIITTAEELSNIRESLDSYFVFGNDIDMAGVESWSPIGTGTAPFSGHLDGQGYAVKNWHTDKGLFGIVLGTNNASLTGLKSDALDENNQLVAANVGESNYTCVIKNINIQDSEIVLSDGMGTLANVVNDAYAENIEMSGCRIHYASGWYTGSIFGEVYKSHVKNLHLAANNVITSAEDSPNLGNSGLMIGSISGSSTERLFNALHADMYPDAANPFKQYSKEASMQYRTIVDRCVNDASVVFHKTYNMGWLGGVIGMVYSRQVNEIVIDCVNNGNITVNNHATKASIGGVCGGHGGGGKLNFIRCANYGNIILTGNPSWSSSNGYDQISGICSYANGPYVDCANYGIISGDAKFLGGICAKTSSNASSAFEHCTNSGTIYSSNSDANLSDICAVDGATAVVIPASEINTSSVTAYRINLTDADSAAGTLNVPASAGVINAGTAFGFTAIDLSNVNGTVVFNVSNATVSLLGTNPDASISFVGENNTITVGQGVILGDVKIDGVGSSIANSGTLGHLTIANSTVVSTNAGAMESVAFVGDNNLAMSFVNNGVIGENNASWHTVQTQSQIALTFTNNGTVYGNGTKYALLFYGMSNVTFNAGADSHLVVENATFTAVFYNVDSVRADTVTFNVAPGAAGVSGESYYGIVTHLSGGITQVTVNMD